MPASTSTAGWPDLSHEHRLQALGYARVAGVDEAGRGPLAGPVVAGAVLLPPDYCAAEYATLTDSKQLSPAAREELFARLTRNFEYGIGIVSAQIIDEINIRQASWRAMQLAVEDLKARVTIDYVLIDGLPYVSGPWPYEALIKGDSQSFSIAAASIIAKVTRDRLMVQFDREYSGYGFARHKGYGTAAHLQALQELGPCAIHRRSFAPVKAASSAS